MAWEEVAGLHELGFEIGNHTAKHANAAEQTREALRRRPQAHRAPLRASMACPRPVSFAYPGNGMGGVVIEVLKERGYGSARSARRRSRISL